LEIDRTAALPRPGRLSWYALRVQSRLAAVAAAALRGKGYEEYSPLYVSHRQWSDRTGKLELPLFPGYMFCKFDVHDRLPVLIAPGVIAIVGAGKILIPVDDAEIEAVRIIVSSGLAAQPWPLLRVGSRVRIARGPLVGLEGLVTDTGKVYRLVVSVSLLQRSIAVEIDRDWASPIPEGMASRAVTRSAP
jgi:transcription antitermination factor NusG